MPAKSKSVLLRVDLGNNGGAVSFRSIEQIEEWVNQEIQYWQWLQKSSSFDRETSAIWTQHGAPWNKLIEKINRLKSNPDEQEAGEHYKAIEQILINAYRETKSLHSSTPRAKRLLDFSGDPSDQKAILTAAYMLGFFINAPFKVSLQRPELVPTVIIALQEASFFSKGITGVSPAELNALNELRVSYTKINDEFKQQIQDNKDLFEKSSEQFENLAKDLTDKFNDLFNTSKKTLEDIANTYDKKLALQASVSYWTTKASRHRNLSIGFGFLFVLSLLAAGYSFFQEIYPLLKDASLDKPIQYWVLSLILIGAVVSIWIVRLVVRVLLSHIHLQRDASERSTMLLTYLALLREGGGLKDDEKKLILQALFRPSSSGIIKDDALPSGMYDLITKLK